MSFLSKSYNRIVAEIREGRRWTKWDSPDTPRVYYGTDHLSARGDYASGGIIKCLDLAEVFPNSLDSANCLYLVSSALPARRELLVRHAQRAGGLIVLNQNGVAYGAWAGSGWREANKPNAWVHSRADHVVYQSAYCQRCAHAFLGEPAGKQHILYNPVDTNVFHPSQNEMPDTVLVAGSHHDAYRVKLAIEAVARVRAEGVAIRLLIAGRLVWSATAEQEALHWVQAMGMRDCVDFVGAYTQQQAPNIFRRASLLLHLKVQDPCPRLIVEAMASGLPVIYSATGGCPELVGDSAGGGIAGEESFEQIVPPDANAVADAIMLLWPNRKRVGEAARNRAVKRFDVGPWIEAHRRIFCGA